MLNITKANLSMLYMNCWANAGNWLTNATRNWLLS